MNLDVSIANDLDLQFGNIFDLPNYTIKYEYLLRNKGKMSAPRPFQTYVDILNGQARYH
jgi:hypothetical protein